MPSDPSLYQAADEAIVSAWLSDATLTTSLEAILSWQGFYQELSEAEDALSQPADPPSLPMGGAYWNLYYQEKPTRANSGQVLPRKAALDIFLKFEPDIERSRVLNAAKEIKARIFALGTSTAVPDTSNPLFPLQSADGYPEFRLLIPVIMS